MLFVSGLVLGGSLGAVLMGLLVAGKKEDDLMDRN